MCLHSFYYHALMCFLLLLRQFLPEKFCDKAVCSSDHAVDDPYMLIVVSLIMDGYHPCMDIFSSLLGSCCLHTALDFFITCAVSMYGNWIVCVTCNFGGI